MDDRYYFTGFYIGIVIMWFIIVGVPLVFYILSLQKALAAVSPENRKLEPGLAWLLLIPVFNIIWNFFIVDAIGVSFERGFQKYGIYHSKKQTYDLGLTMSILCCCYWIPLLNILAILGSFVIWIIYWIKVVQYKNELISAERNNNLAPGETSIFI